MIDRRSTGSPIWTPRDIPIPSDGGFVLLVDDQEKGPQDKEENKKAGVGWIPHPLFDLSLPFVRRMRLKNGDYTLQGFEKEIYVEVKRLSDFLSFTGSEREAKTERKLAGVSDFFFKALVVVESENVLHSPTHLYSTLTPEHVRGFLTSLTVKRNIHFYCNPSEDAVRRWILDRLICCYNFLRAGGA